MGHMEGKPPGKIAEELQKKNKSSGGSLAGLLFSPDGQGDVGKREVPVRVPAQASPSPRAPRSRERRG